MCRRSKDFIAVVTLVSAVTMTFPMSPVEWRKQAQEKLIHSLTQSNNVNTARNIVLFIGDGMGVSTVTAARILRGQLENKTGEETVMEFEKFPHLALSKTYLPDRQVADSSATATAIMSGIKTNYYMVGVNSDGVKDECDVTGSTHVDGILHWSRNAGKSTGIVTTSRVTHATPASAYAHVPNRYWESNIDLPNITQCKDIAKQLVYDNNDIQVILGGGRRAFLSNDSLDPETGTTTQAKQRTDQLNLVKEWESIMERKGRSHKYIWNTTDFLALDVKRLDYVLGLFESGHMQYELERDKSPSGEPSLAEMTSKAIQILKKNDKGFFLMVEGGRIDHGHHENKAKKALYETLVFEDAVRTAVDMTDEKDTLILVTADHSHVFNIAGYPKRGNDILGVVDPLPREWYPSDNIPYTTLLYANGPGYNKDREDPSKVDIHDNDYVQTSAVPLESETHGGEDVAVYARGPMSHLIQGVIEQHYIAHVMAYASCVGENKDHCARTTNSAMTTTSKLFPLYVVILLHGVAFLSRST